MRNNIYMKKSLRSSEGIPIFSEENKYIENYEEIASDHISEMKKTGENPFQREEYWVEIENSTRDMIQKYIRDEKYRILDVGVGLGRLLDKLPSSLEKYGMDISMDYLKVARKKNIDVCCSLIEDMPYQQETFDIVACTDVLEHVLDLNLACKKILFVLKKGGLLFVRVPYKENLRYYLDPDYPYKYAHLRNFDEYSLRLLFENVFGCKVMEYKTAGLIIGRDKLKLYLPDYLKIIFCDAVRYTALLSKRINKMLIKLMYEKSEINLVIRK